MTVRTTDQQRLFEDHNPLEERLGSHFFDQLPQEPGIYQMYGRDDRLLYVGKAKNLRTRLFTYRRALPGKASRKTVRLVRMIHRIEYRVCRSEMEALLTENRLIRDKRPEFNHAKKSPETYYHIHLREDDGHLQFKLNMDPDPGEAGPWSTFGAFKGHLLVRRSLGALLRLLYIAGHQLNSPHLLPPSLLRNLTPMDYRLPPDPERQTLPLLHRPVEELLSGESDRLLSDLLEIFRERSVLDSYIGKLVLEDLEAANKLFEKCCRRNYLIKTKFGLDAPVIPQHRLDDYLIRLAFA